MRTLLELLLVCANYVGKNTLGVVNKIRLLKRPFYTRICPGKPVFTSISRDLSLSL